jgi:hypothetical protein
MIDNDELLTAIVGERRVATFKEVKLTSMRLARVVREVIAEDLHGTLPTTGKQFLTTRHGVFRLASRPNSDNTTEQLAHERMGARTVQVRLRCSIRHVSRLIEGGRLESVHGPDRVERVIEASIVEFERKQQAALERATKPKDELDDPGAAPE